MADDVLAFTQLPLCMPECLREISEWLLIFLFRTYWRSGILIYISLVSSILCLHVSLSITYFFNLQIKRFHLQHCDYMFLFLIFIDDLCWMVITGGEVMLRPF